MLAGAVAVGSAARPTDGTVVDTGDGPSLHAAPAAETAPGVAGTGPETATVITATSDEGQPSTPTGAASAAQLGAIDPTPLADDVQVDAVDAGTPPVSTAGRADARTVLGQADATTAVDSGGHGQGRPAGPASRSTPPAPLDGTAALRHGGARGAGPAATDAHHATAGDVSSTPGDAQLPIPAGADDDHAGSATQPATLPPFSAAASATTQHLGTAPVGAPAPTTTGTPLPSSSAPTTQPAGSAALAASDTIRFLRELGPARAVQRLAVDLDGAMVAVRVDHTGATPVRVQIVDDPAGRLDRSWVTSVERTLSHSMQRDGSGAPSGHRRRDPHPHPDDLAPTPATGRRWADALGEET